MSRAVLNVKVNPETKAKAKMVADSMGLSLSALVNGFLTDLVKTKKVEFRADEVPTPKVQKILRQAEKDYKEGNTSPAFETGEEAVAWLEKQGI